MEALAGKNGISILFVDDEREVLSALRRFLLKEPYQTHFAGSAREALAMADTNPVDILVTDLRMPEVDGLELIRRFRSKHPATLRLILSASRDVDQTIESINDGGVFRFIPKPLEPQQFKQILADAAEYCLMKKERQTMQLELAARNRQLEEINASLRTSQESLRASEEYLRTLTNMAYDAIILLEGLRIVFWNQAAERLLGYSRHQAIGADLLELLLPLEERSRYGERFARMLDGCQRPGDLYGEQLGEVSAQNRDGRKVLVELSAASACIAGKAHIVIVARNMQHRLEAERTKAQFEQLQRSIESRIEKNLLQSKAPEGLNGISLATCSIASGHLGGDFTDFIVYDPNRFDLLIADVMGKGVRAALAGAGMKAKLLKILAQQRNQVDAKEVFSSPSDHQTSVVEVLDRLDRLTADDLMDLEMFITLAYARFDAQARQMTYLSCGHTWSLHYQAQTGSCQFLKGDNLPLGVEKNSTFQETTVAMHPGDVFLFHSDGLTEAENNAQEQYGYQRLQLFLEKHHHLDPARLVTCLQREIVDFTGREQLADDFTVIAVKALEEY